jgi:hypothetical protein
METFGHVLLSYKRAKELPNCPWPLTGKLTLREKIRLSDVDCDDNNGAKGGRC